MSNARKILLVDADRIGRKNFEQVLAGKGYAVIPASSGEDALWQFSNGTYDAVFTDIRLRGMSGLELAEEIHARQPGLPVVIITGDGSAISQERAAGAGTTEFLHKPISPEQLADAADRLLPATNSDVVLQPQTAAAEAVPAQAMNKVAARLQNIVLFFLAPVFAFGYILAFPVVWLGVLVWSAFNEKKEAPEEAEQPLHSAEPGQPSVLKTIATLLVAVLIGVAFAVVGPILGIGLLFSYAIQAWVRLGAKAMGPSET